MTLKRHLHIKGCEEKKGDMLKAFWLLWGQIRKTTQSLFVFSQFCVPVGFN